MARLLRSYLQDFVQEVPVGQLPPLVISRWYEGEGEVRVANTPPKGRRTHVNTQTYIMYMHIHTCIYIYTCVHKYMHINICVYIYIHIYICVSVYIYIHIFDCMS